MYPPIMIAFCMCAVYGTAFNPAILPAAVMWRPDCLDLTGHVGIANYRQQSIIDAQSVVSMSGVSILSALVNPSLLCEVHAVALWKAQRACGHSLPSSKLVNRFVSSRVCGPGCGASIEVDVLGDKPVFVRLTVYIIRRWPLFVKPTCGATTRRTAQGQTGVS